MPKTTFLNLPDEKKAKILLAAKKELSETPFEAASINKIIKEAEISRGSFYMYFEDKYDLISVLLDDFKDQYQSAIISIARTTNGSLKKIIIGIHDYVYQEIKDKENCGLLKNFLIYSSTNFQKNDNLKRVNPLFLRIINQFMHLIDNNQFKLSDAEYIKNVVEISFAALREALRQAIINDIKIEDSRAHLIQLMDILQEGYSRKEEKTC